MSVIGLPSAPRYFIIMRTFHGTVKNIRHTVEVNSDGGVTGTGYHSSTSTTHVALVELDSGHRVQFASTEPAFLSRGDRVVFAGAHTRRGVFHARAYYNHTARVSGNDGTHWYALAFGVLLAVFCPLGAVFALAAGQGSLTAGLILLAATIGVGLTYYGFRQWRAVRSLAAGEGQSRPPAGGPAPHFLK